MLVIGVVILFVECSRSAVRLVSAVGSWITASTELGGPRTAERPSCRKQQRKFGAETSNADAQFLKLVDATS